MRVLVAHPHAIVRDALATVVQRLNAAASVVAVSDAHAAELECSACQPDLALIDSTLLTPSVKRLVDWRRRYPTVPVIVLAGQNDPVEARGLMTSGAAAVVVCSGLSVDDGLLRSCRAVLAGNVVVPVGQCKSVVAAAASNPAQLSARQLDVLRALIDGVPNRQIAHRLRIAESVVKVDVAAILLAFGVRNRSEAVRRCLEYGFPGDDC
jgi:DNA-binding NarL/FixJ family response regulator